MATKKITGVSLENVTIEADEGESGVTPITFTVTRSGDTSAKSTVQFAVTGSGRRPAQDDDVVNAGVVVFEEGETTKELTVQVIGDANIEPDEGFTVTLTDANNAVVDPNNNSAQGVILDDDVPLVSLEPGSVKVDEGDSGVTPITFTVTRSGDTSAESTVQFEVTGSGRNPAQDNDVVNAGVVVFEAGETTKELTVSAIGDTDPESDEGFTVTLTNANNAVIDPRSNSAQGVILDDDLPQVSLTAVAPSSEQFEGNPDDPAQTIFTFTVTRTGDDLSQPSTVDWTIDHIDTEPADFLTQLVGRVMFDAGETDKTFSVTVNNEDVFEGDESFMATLSAPTNAAIGTGELSATILNDDSASPPPVVAITPADAVQPEGDAGATLFTFEVTRTGDDLSQASTVDWAVTQVDDLDPQVDAADFVTGTTSGQVTFAAGDAGPQTITVEVQGDLDVEGDEAFKVELSAPDNATISETAGSALGTILEDDLPQVSLTAVAPSIAELEGNPGDDPLTTFTFTVTRTGDDLSQPSSVAWAVTHIDTEPFDFATANQGGVTFAAGQETATFELTVSNDADFEPDEAFTVVLSAPTNATIGTAELSATILNDDSASPPPVVAITPADAVQPEGDAGATLFTFEVTRTGDDLSQASTVDWAVTQVDDLDPQVDAADFVTGTTSGQVTFAAGDAGPQTITVEVQGDLDVEGDEAFKVELSAPDNATISETAGSALGTILEDDLPQVSLTAVAPSIAELEGNPGDDPLTTFTFTVTRTGDDLSQPSSVAWAVTHIDTEPFDFATANQGGVTFAAGQETATFELTVSNDADFEPDEAFTVVLSAPTNATIGTAELSATILNDDSASAPPVVAITPADAVQPEGDADATLFTFEVTRTGDDLSQASTVDWAVTQVDDLDPQVDAADFVTGTTSGQVTFAAGDAGPQTITVEVQGDLDVEGDEAFKVELSAPDNATISETAGSALGTILEDDLPQVSLTGVAPSNAELEGNPGDDPLIFTFTVTRTGDDLKQASTVDWTVNHVDTEPADFLTQLVGRVMFEAGETEKTFSITVNNEDVFEGDESFTATLSAPTNSTIGTGGLTATILNDDSAARGNSIYISDVQIAEGDDGSTTDAVFTVSLSTPVDASVTVDYATADGTATAGSDYTAVEGTLTFAPGQTVQEVWVPITGDGAVEPNESFFVNLSSPVNDVIADGQGLGTISDDDGSGIDLGGTSADEVFDGTDGDDILQGGAGDDVLTGAEGDDALTGGAGDDAIDGAADNDVLAGGSGDDTLDGGSDDDTIVGGSDNDVLEGGAGNDTLAGGSGDDQLSGGGGNDALFGGSGNDTFVFRAADGDSGQDTIRLFNSAEDTLVFENYGQKLDAFSDLDTNANGELDEADTHVSVDAGNTVIDLGGQTDGESEGTLTLVGVTGLEADDMSFG